MIATALKSRLAATCIAALAGLALTSCGGTGEWTNTVLTGSSMRDLGFEMTRVDDGTTVTEANYRGKVTMLYFGYTYCPDVCPATLTNLQRVFETMGDDAEDVRVLFATVDPERDTPEVLKDYVDVFGARFDGLRGTDNQLTRLARRYRVSYSVTPGTADTPYEVSHSSALYVFDRTGDVRLLVTSMNAAEPKIEGTARDLERLVAE